MKFKTGHPFNKNTSSSGAYTGSLYMTTLLIWAFALLISVPINYLAMPDQGISAAVIESASAWTATGISAYDASVMPLWLLILRSCANWAGGVGIIMLIMSLLSSRGLYGRALAATEFPGPDFMKNESGFRRYYRRIVLLYAAMSALEFVMLLIAGMDLPDSVMTALSGPSTAGLHHINNGVITGLSVPVKIIITVFAFFGSLNSLLLIHLTGGRFKDAGRSSEGRFYAVYIAFVTLIVSICIYASNRSISVLRTAAEVLMQAVSAVSTSGYIISDVSALPPAAVSAFLILAFTGACSLSTGGGIKAGRVIISAKTASYNIYRHIHPSSVRSLTFDKKALKSDQVTESNLYIALFMFTYLIGALLLSVSGMSLHDALCYSQAMITGSGTSMGLMDSPGLAAGLSPYSRIVCSVIMLAGRLEIYPLIMILFRVPVRLRKSS